MRKAINLAIKYGGVRSFPRHGRTLLVSWGGDYDTSHGVAGSGAANSTPPGRVCAIPWRHAGGKRHPMAPIPAARWQITARHYRMPGIHRQHYGVSITKKAMEAHKKIRLHVMESPIQKFEL